jgi:hypothetical protein
VEDEHPSGADPDGSIKLYLVAASHSTQQQKANPSTGKEYRAVWGVHCTNASLTRRQLSNLNPRRRKFELLLACLALRAVFPAGFNLVGNENPV